MRREKTLKRKEAIEKAKRSGSLASIDYYEGERKVREGDIANCIDAGVKNAKSNHFHQLDHITTVVGSQVSNQNRALADQSADSVVMEQCAKTPVCRNN